ncbi:MAG: PQQ-binding-like beta-propeller repeat protein [Bacteroidota bacterium]
MHLRHKSCHLLLFITFTFFSLNAQEPLPHWTHYRGSNLNGISSGTGFPVTWNDSTHVKWKTAIEGKGWSSPVVYGDQVWLTTEKEKEMRAICIDSRSGEILHNRVVFNPDTLYRKHSVNTYATPTSAIEKDFIYVHFGRYGTACLDTRSGETVWERTDMQVEHLQGPGSSLRIYKEKLIVHLEGTDIQYITALDKKTGKTLWKTHRPAELYNPLDPIGKKAYITPIIINVNGRDLMISNGSAVCIAYDPETGKEVWRIIQGEDSTISMPVESNGIVYFYTGYVTGEDGKKYAELFAVNPNGEGDIGDSNILWRVKSPILQLLTPVIVDGLLYTVDSKGLLSCLEGETGETIWSKNLKGKYHSSPVFANRYIYISSTRGRTVVIKAGRELQIVSENTLDGEIWATPALTDGAIFMRTSKYLYKIASH